MLSATVLSAEEKLGGHAIRWAGAIVALLAVLCFSAPAALGQCTLGGTVSTWNDGSSNWNGGSNWSPTGVPNSSSTSVCITDHTSTVTLDINATVDNLQLASGNALNVQQSSTLAITGALTNLGAINTGNGDNDPGSNAVNVSGLLTNNGTITLAGFSDSLSAAGLTNAGAINLNGLNANLTASYFNNNSGGSLTLFESGMSVAGDFNNSGASLVLSDGSGMSVTGDFNNNSGASLWMDYWSNLGVGGAFNNNGASLSLSDGSGMSVAGDFNNNSGGVNLSDSYTMSVGGAFNNNGGVSESGTGDWISVGGAFNNHGSLDMEGEGGSVSVAGDFNNYSGSSVMMGPAVNQVHVGGNFNNNSGASVEVYDLASGVNVGGAFNNNGGTVTLGGDMDGVSASTFNNNGGTVTLSGGQNNIWVGGAFSNNGGTVMLRGDSQTISAGTFNNNAGTVSGGGRIIANVHNVGGTVTASDSGVPDTLTIDGNYTQGAGGTLEAFLGGPEPGTGYSQLFVDGKSILDGTLDVDIISGFFPTSGENFFLLTSTHSVLGAFANLDLPSLPSGDSWLVSYNKNCPTRGCVELTFEGPTTHTPEPSIFLLLVIGIAMMTIFLKYRNTVRSGIE